MSIHTPTQRHIKLASPDLPPGAIARAVEVLESGALVQGRFVEALEHEIAAYLDMPHAVVVSSGTAALHLSLLAAGVGPGDEVIVPAFTFPATANAVVATGAKPVLVDIYLSDYGIDCDSLLSKITPKTKAIIPVHEFGLACDIGRIAELARAHRLIVIEDAACALGAEFAGQKAGNFGKFGCFSFHPRKAVTTGEGGVIVTRDEESATRLRALRSHGIESTPAGMDIREAGFNYRMTDFQAALAFEQIAIFDDQIADRRHIANIYSEVLADVADVTTPIQFADRPHTFQTYHVLLDESLSRQCVIDYLRERGIESNFGAWALNFLTFYRDRYGCKGSDYPNAIRAFRGGLALPIGRHVGEADARYIASVLKDAAHCCHVET